PLWDGKDIRGQTILLHAEQGLGDTIQFARYSAMVNELGARVVLACQRPLVPLLGGLAGVDQVVAQGDPSPYFDWHARLLSLPRILGTRLDTIPAKVPYLRPRPDLATRWREELHRTRGFKVAIHWQGSKKYRDDWQRSMLLAYFGALGRIEGVQLFSLQKGYGREQLKGIDFPVIDLADRLDGAETG